MNEIELTFHCVQPIEIESDLYAKLITNQWDISKSHQKFNNNFKIKWLKEFSNKNNIYDYMYSIKTTSKISGSIFFQNLNIENYKVNGIDISTYIDKQAIEYELLLDIRFLYFIVVYEIKLKIPMSDLEQLLSDKNGTLYKVMRSLFVKESDKSTISQWVEATREQSFRDIEILSNSFNKMIKVKHLSIKNNTGNITSFVLHNLKDPSGFSQKIIKCNEFAERLKVESLPIYQDHDVSYSFYGRFHTIIINDESFVDRYMPIQFHVQYLWFLLNYYNNLMDKLNITLTDKSQVKDISIQNEIIDELINKIEMLVIHNERFSTAIEIDNELIYKKIENKWNLFKSLENSKNYINFFKGYLERAFNKSIAKSQKKQNKILFTISFLQIAALIGVWNDYLSLLDEKSIKNIDEILFLFAGNKDNLMLFNEYIPIYLFIITFIALMYLIIKK